MTSIRFGEDFELDLQAYELRRAGLAIRLERIPMEILRLLVEHRDQLVTREQIVERVWGKDVFVETDNSINIAVRKVRSALKDDPENPRFIRTVTGKGYRFVAPFLEDRETPPPPAPAVRRRWPLFLGLAILAIAAAGYFLRPHPPSVAARSADGRVMLAVLPFANLTGDTGQEYFSDGLTEEMIGRLGSLSPQRLGVIARASVMHYKGTREPLDTMARELGVDYVLEGSVRRDPVQVRITVQLIRVADQTHVWSRQYDREPSDVLRVQAEIAQAIADEIQLTLGETGEQGRVATLTARDLAAYDHYLKGRFAWNERTADGFQRAIASFEAALAAKPDYAQAHAGLADCYTLMNSYSLAPPGEAIPKARAAALRALAIDEHLAAAHASLALIQETHDFDWPAAEAGFKRAVALDPNYVTARHWYAEFLAFQGRFPEALDEIERARQLDPLSLIVAVDRGAILHQARRFDEAIRQFQAVLAIDPGFPRANIIVGSYTEQGRYKDALARIATWRKLDRGPWPAAWSAHVLGRAGRRAEAQQALEEMEALNRSAHLDPIGLHTLACLGMGEKEAAIGWLQKACAQRSNVLAILKVDPSMDPIREDPRFAELLRCANLEP